METIIRNNQRIMNRRWREREIIGGLFDSFAARWINPEAPLPYPIEDDKVGDV